MFFVDFYLHSDGDSCQMILFDNIEKFSYTVSLDFSKSEVVKRGDKILKHISNSYDAFLNNEDEETFDVSQEVQRVKEGMMSGVYS